MKEVKLSAPTSVILEAGTDPISDLSLLVDGVPKGFVNLSTSLAMPGIWKVTFTPTFSGVNSIVHVLTIVAERDAVAVLSRELIQDVLDDAMGSWTWDKATGVLETFRANGEVLAGYSTTDTLTSASRERT